MARELTKEIYRITSGGPFSCDFRLCNQIRDASGSIMSNITEGFDRDGNKEFCNFRSVAKASAGEVRSQLYIAMDQNYISVVEFERIYNMADETGKIIGGLMRYLRSSDVRGLKFKTSGDKQETRNSKLETFSCSG